MNWQIDNGIIVGHNNGMTVVPTTKEIYVATDTITVSGNTYPFNIKLSFMKIVPLNVEINFVVNDGKIYCDVYALLAKNKIKVTSNNGYIIFNGVWYYLDATFNELLSIFDNNKCNLFDCVSYFEYIKLINDLKCANIPYTDVVVDYLDEIKQRTSLISANNINGTLFGYQKSGVNWLLFMSNGNCGCILGDEMGLGKTLQIIGLFSTRIEQFPNAKFLVVAPVSLLANWQREIEKFAPTISSVIHHGTNRTGFYTELLKYNVVITSYTTIQTDLSMFKMINWDLLILDEAQNIKNPYSHRRININEINRRMTIAVTGTPFENHVSDVWSISDFVIPGYFGSLNEYEHRFGDDVPSAKSIEKMLTPIMIRRLVSDVADELPEKIVIPQPILMTDEEAKYYESRKNSFSGVAALKQKRLDLIQELRMFCSHPMVYRDNLVGLDPASVSNKYARACDIIKESIYYGNKTLIFTSFNKMIDIFCKDLPSRFKVPTMFINGSTNPVDRQKIIDEFSAINGAAVLVLNPKAAGAGLNITCANRVIHYNPEWNPAIESQATARAYRRGQKQTVFVYRLYYTGTIEEFINDKIEHKQMLFDDIVVGNDGNILSSELVKALNYSPTEAVSK